MKARFYAIKKAREEWEQSGNISEVIRVYQESKENFAATMAELREAREARAKRFNIGVKAGGRLTPPKGYPTDIRSYGDPANYRYPAENYDRARAALTYFNQVGQREAGDYTPAEWGIIGRRLARLITRHLPAQYQYKDGRIARKED